MTTETDPTIQALDQMIAELEQRLEATKSARGQVILDGMTDAKRSAALAAAITAGNVSPELAKLLAKAKPVGNTTATGPDDQVDAQASPPSVGNTTPAPGQPPSETPPTDAPSPPPVNAAASAAPEAGLGRVVRGRHRGVDTERMDYSVPWMGADPTPWAHEPVSRVIRDDPRPFNPPISQRPAASPVLPPYDPFTSQRAAATPVTRAPVDPHEFLRNCWRLWGGKISGHVWTMGRRTPWRVKQAMQPEFNRSGHSWQVEVFSWRQPDESEREFCSRLARNDRAWDNLERRHRPWTPGPGLDESNRHVQEYRRSQAAARGRGW